MTEPSHQMPLGIDGFTYADLYQPSRLRDLHDAFCARVADDDPDLWALWDAYRTAPETVTVLEVGSDAVEIAVSAAGETVPHFRRRFAAAETGVVRLCGFDGRDRVASLEAAIDVERLDVCIPEREVAASAHEDGSPDDEEGSPDD